VPDSFHARYSAQARRYVYRILNRRNARSTAACVLGAPAIDTDACTGRAVPVGTTISLRSVQRMPVQVGAARLLEIAASDGDYIDIGVRANAFLHHMVRNIAGTLLLWARATVT